MRVKIAELGFRLYPVVMAFGVADMQQHTRQRNQQPSVSHVRY